MRHLTGAPLDRQDHRRQDGDLLDDATRVLTFDAAASAVRVTGPADAPRVATRTLGELDGARGDLLFLGEREGDRWAARSVDEAAPGSTDPDGRFESVRAAASMLPADEAGLVVYGAGLLGWSRRARFCGSCGGATAPTHAGHQRRCDACGGVDFPRTDPAVITLVRRGERALLISQPRWPPDRFAAVAGFVEPGETLEAAVAREVEEEVGLTLERVEYLGSQPWPFPHSVMIGFRAWAAPGALRIGHEVREARWVSRQELRDAVDAGEITIPTPFSISRSLIDDWLGPS